ncbi:AraC family ligand binding domain-containing protein [Sphingomonas sp. LR61]|uniref:AraC family ligand binding domain-containing protein n=1 Tax=Sphingomonas sp. LR61 TaxID=3050234 RepID=UPI002FE2074E
MRNVPVSEFDHQPFDVLPIGTDYPPDHLLARHEHRRAQLLYGASGVMLVETDDGSWTVPTDRAVLIPPGVPHEVRMLDVSTWSLYIEPDTVPWWPTRCTVVEVGPLLREVLRAANALDVPYDDDARDGTLVRLALHELQRVAPIPLGVSLPPRGVLRDLCRAYLAEPDVHVTNADWARGGRLGTHPRPPLPCGHGGGSRELAGACATVVEPPGPATRHRDGGGGPTRLRDPRGVHRRLLEGVRGPAVPVPVRPCAPGGASAY